jgi:anti-anti-sigma factor
MPTRYIDTEIPASPARIEIYPPSRHEARLPTVIAVNGEIDASNVEEINALAEDILTQQSDIVIDLSEVTFMATRGLRTLTELPEAARSHGVGCAVVTSHAIDHLLDVIDRQRPEWVYDTADSALDAVAVKGFSRGR